MKNRKVKFTHYVAGVRETPAGAYKDGTGCWSPEIEGTFLEWGLDSDEGASYSVGIIETSDGKIILANPAKMQFTEPIS